MRGLLCPQGRSCVSSTLSANNNSILGCSGAGTCTASSRVRASALAAPPSQHRRGSASSYEPCEPSTSSSSRLAEYGARVTLERIYNWTPLGQSQPELGLSTLLVTVDDRPQRTRNNERSEDYFANVGDAIRCLREDIPALFERELNYSIYREDIVFRDPRNCFKGMKNYQTVFWSLRFHGKIFFSKLYVDVKRIWQPEDGIIKMRWTVHGIPRVPWEAEGTFDGISTYRLDSHGKIYEHSVDNILLRDPPMATNPPLLAGLNLQPLVPQQPVPGAWCQGSDLESPSWGTYQYVQRMVCSALQMEQQREQEPTPAVAGVPSGASGAMEVPLLPLGTSSGWGAARSCAGSGTSSSKGSTVSNRRMREGKAAGGKQPGGGVGGAAERRGH